MTSVKQITANRHNAKKSTGPRSPHGKLRARQSAFKHGLTAETVIALLEKAEEYEALECGLAAEYEPNSTLERVLVARLASLLWRLRRAAAIETGLFEAQAHSIFARKSVHKNFTMESHKFEDLPHPSPNLVPEEASDRHIGKPGKEPRSESNALRPGISECFFRLLTEQGDLLERLGRYEAIFGAKQRTLVTC
jgi:hypothetical protein